MSIAHQRGTVLREHRQGKNNGDMFSDFIGTHLQETFNRCRIPKDKRFVLYKTVKKQEELWIQLEESNLAYLNSPGFNPI